MEISQLKEELAGMLTGLQGQFKAIRDEQTSMQKRIDDIEVRSRRPENLVSEGRSIRSVLAENESVKRLMRDRRGTAVIEVPRSTIFETRTTITSTAVGSATSGVLMFERTPGIVPPARRQPFVRDLLTVIPTQFNAIDYVKVSTDFALASPQVEASAKFENSVSFTTVNAPVKLIATWVPASRQVLEDFDGLEGFIRSSLADMVRLKEEQQIIAGSGTGEDLNGLTNQAASFNAGLLYASDGWEKVDIIGRAIQQIESANEFAPDFVLLNPADFWDNRLLKDTTGQYIFGNPLAGNPPRLFGLNVISSTVIPAGTFLVGSSSPAVVVLRQRGDLTVEISTEHANFFTENKVAVRAEERLALVVFRPNAFVTGSLTTSPA